MLRHLIIISSMLFTLNVFAQNPRASVNQPEATSILVALQRKNSVSPQITMGFMDSSFDYGQKEEDLKPQNKTMCYLGDVAGVCPQIRDYEKAMNRRYREGAHDDMYVHSCRSTQDKSVKVNYWLRDDYGGDLRVNREIKPCQSR